MCQTRPRVYHRSMRLINCVARGTSLLVAIGFLGCHNSNGSSDGGVGPDMAAPPYYGNCTAPARPPSNVALQLVNAFPGRSFSQPLAIRQAPGDAAHFY